MYILDTDHMSLLERASSHEAQRLHFRLKKLLPEERLTTIISFEEQVRGWMSLLAKARDLEQQIFAYEKLKRTLKNFGKLEVLDFNNSAAAQFEQLQKQRIRIGTMDLKIAAIAIANDATLLSRNLKDFSKIPNLKVEDWAA